MKYLSLFPHAFAVGLLTSLALSPAHASPSPSRTRSTGAITFSILRIEKNTVAEQLAEGGTYLLPSQSQRLNIRAETQAAGIKQVRFVLRSERGVLRRIERHRPYELFGDSDSRAYPLLPTSYTVSAVALDKTGKVISRGKRSFSMRKAGSPPPTISPTRTPIRTAPPTIAPTRTPVRTPLPTRTATVAATQTATRSPTRTPIRTVAPTRTATPTPMALPTRTPPPERACSIPGLTLPRPADTTRPSSVVGNGTAGSCTEGALASAIDKGGVVTFDCGPDPVTITLSSEKTVTKNTTIDGGGKVTLSGGQRTRILSIKHFYDRSEPVLTVQNLTFKDGRTTDVPNTHSTETGGAAIYRLGGTLNVFNSHFINNKGPVTGQDVAGGAIYSIGGGITTIIGSTFEGNECSNGGALGNLGNSLNVVNSSIRNNRATGTGGNPGNGGNGAGICIDGAGTTVNICNTEVLDNSGNAYGGGIFRVSYSGEPTNIDNSIFQGNELSVGLGGGVYLQGTRITMNDSAITGNKAPIFPNLFQGPGATLTGSNNTIE